MATIALALVGLSILVGSSDPAVAFDMSPAGLIQVTGKVMCQDCSKGYNEWVRGSQPIKGCKVSLTCMDERSRVMHYASDETDDRGVFNMVVNSHINGKELKAKLCKVRLVSSPHPSCHIATDFAGGRSGVNLSQPAAMDRNLVKYVLGTFYYTTPMCKKPDVLEESDEGKGSKY